jgi:capsular exopolysaccharide synthesis family protein
MLTSRYDPIVVRDDDRYDDADSWGPSGFDESQRLQLAAIWGAVLKHRWVIIGSIAGCLLLGVAATLLMQPLYTAQTTLQIDRESSKVLDVEGLVPTEALTGNEFFDTQVGLLKSETLARRVVQSLNLGQDAIFLRMAGEDLSAKARADRTKSAATLESELTETLMQNVSVKQLGLSRLVSVDFTSPDPALSARVANALAANFVTTSLERRFEASSYARNFLEERLLQVKQKLEETEKELVAYAARQQIINVVTESGSGPTADGATQSLTASNLSALNSALTAAKAERIKAEQRWRQAQSTPVLSLLEVLGDPTVQRLRQDRATLSATYQQKLKIYAPDFPEMQQLQAQIDEVDRQINAVANANLSSIRSQYEIALKQEQSFAEQVEKLKGSFMDLRERNIQYTILQREVDTNRTLYEGLLQRYKEVGVAGGLGSNNISIVDRALAPDRPSSPKPLINMALALLLGLGLGAGATVLLELLDESIRTPDDVVTKLGLTLVGAIPELEKGATPMNALADPRSAFTEAYSSARTSLQFSTNEGLPHSLLVTSSRPSEGKSTTALALARSFTHLGLKVLLVDSDLRNPSLHRLLSLNNNVGLSNFLTGEELDAVMQTVGEPAMAVVPCGPLPPNPAELLAGARFPQLLEEAKSRFDLLVIDGPPVIGLADAPILASRAAATVLVVEAGGARRSVVRIATKRLLQARARLLGALLTKFDAKSSSYGYGYGYSYAYSYEYGQKRLDKDAA